MRSSHTLLALGLSVVSVTTASQPLGDAAGCVAKRAPIERLACFDRHYGTPAYLDRVEVPVEHRPDYGIVEAVNQHEQRRADNDYGLMVSTRVEHAASEQQRVVMTAPALGAVGVRPIFALSCIDNITRVQLILPNAMAATRAVIGIADERARPLLDEQWRIIGGGYIIEAGRGIASIRVAQKLLGAKRLNLRSAQAAIDGLSFDVAGLPKHIRALQTACHWRSRHTARTGEPHG